MVSPHQAWEETDRGYVRGDTGVFVEPAIVESDGDGRWSGGIPEDRANAYAVELRTGPDGAEEWAPLVHFPDPLPAWDFVHLLTHYLAHPESPAAADLIASAEGSDDGSLPDLAKNLTGEQAFLLFLPPAGLPDSMEQFFDENDLAFFG